MDVVRTQRKMVRGTTSPSSATSVNSNGVGEGTRFSSDIGITSVESCNSNNAGGQQQQPPNGSDSMTTTTMTTTTTTPVSRPGPFARFRRRAVTSLNPGKARPRRSFSAPASTGRSRRRRMLMEDHYRVDPERRVVLPGVPKQDPNFARDMHDFYNLVVLVPVVALNVMNWNWDMIIKIISDGIVSPVPSASSPHYHHHHHGKNQYHRNSLEDAWTGEWFDLFFQVTVLYFMVDLLWIIVVPSCVRSPATIIQHHVATMLYILIPYFQSEFQWCMGACMIVEINTWFLIARRVFNKQGFPPWIFNFSYFSIRVKIISVLFYVTWISIRCILYPYLMPRFYENWVNHSRKVGTPWNLVALCVPLHAIFCMLNMKWTYDLLMSKIRFWTRPAKNGKAVSEADKGL